MTMKMIFDLSLALLLFLPPAVSFAWTPFAYDRGNLKYEKKKYEASSEFYREALEGSPAHPRIHYNLGNSLYRNGRYEEAREEFLAVLKAEDPALRERGLYNLGNTQFRLGDLPGAIQSYEQAMALNSGNEKARLNRDYVKRLLEEKKKEEKKEEETKNEEQQNEERKKEGDEESQKQKKEEGDSGEKKEGSAEEEKEKEKDQDQDQEMEVGAGETVEEKKPEPKMTPDEGETLLESLEDDRSGAIREMVKRHTKKKETEIEKDW